MIGVVVTGHGTLASGMKEAVKLLAGKPEAFAAVDYRQEDTADDYEENLKDVLRQMTEVSSVLILVDMVEAMPYKTAVSLKNKLKDEKQIEIVAGVNLGMLTQVNLARGYVYDVKTLADLAVSEGKKHIVKYE